MDYISEFQDYIHQIPLPSSFSDLPSLSHLSHLSTVSSYTSWIITQMNVLAQKIHDLAVQLTGESSATPSLTTIALLLIILFLSLKLLNMLYRTIVFWVKMVFRVAVLGAVVGAGAWVYVRGVDGLSEDVSGLVDYWGQEYRKYEALGRAGEGYRRH